jgi:hypothetical protein
MRDRSWAKVALSFTEPVDFDGWGVTLVPFT